jgi:hypothetical protein
LAAHSHARETEAPKIAIPRDLGDDDLVVLPREIDADGRGLYDESVLTLVKELRAAGARARFQHEQESRTWIGERAVPQQVVDLLIGIGSNAGWAILCRWFRQGKGSEPVRVRVGAYSRVGSEVSIRWYEVEGSGEDVATALAAIEPAEEELQAAEEEED